MTELSDTERHKRALARSFATEERTRQAEQRIADEEKRVAANAAKTANLRKLREARDAAERKTSALAIVPTTPEAKPVVRILRPRVRPTKGGK